MKELKDLIKSISDGSSSAHAYILEGGAGSRRDEFLMSLVSGLECLDDNPEGRPCGHCSACIQAAAFTNPDVIYMQKSGKSSYKSEDAVAFTERLGMRPYGRYLIGVISEAEALSEIVQNKLLKTLEEPLEKVMLFLLTSRSDELLSTVRSRCSLIRIDEFEGYAGSGGSEVSEEMKEGVDLMLSSDSDFYRFREFAEKNIKTADDASLFIGFVEERLHDMMRDGLDIRNCVEMIEASEKTAMEIGRGMDKNKALKKLFLSFR